MGPVEQERHLVAQGLLFSTIDSRDAIHPELPGCVTELLSGPIEQGNTIAAYLKNQPRIGEPDWVMATVTRCHGGHVSIAVKPSTRYFETARALYGELLELERELGGDRETERERAGSACAARLGEILRDAGFADYSAFMHAALSAEIASHAVHEIAPRAGRAGAADRRLVTLRTACQSTGDFLDGLFGARLDGHIDLNDELSSKSAYVLELAETLRLFALNALLASTRLGADGIVLRAVADIMRSSSDSIRALIRGLSDHLDGAEGLLGEVGFRVSVAKLQSLTATVFADELLDGGPAPSSDGSEPDPRLHDLARLSGCLDDSFKLLRESLDRLEFHLRGVARSVERLADEIKVMRALEVNGRIEAARAANVDAIVFLFAEIRAQINTARDELAAFADITQRGRETASRRSSPSLRISLSKIHDCTARLAA